MINMEYFNTGLALLVMAGQIVAVVTLMLLAFSKAFKLKFSYLDFVAKYAMQLSFVVLLVAVSGSLFYSEIALYEPCKLCWLQRIFIFPQLLVLGMAMYFKDSKAIRYTFAMSLIALSIAVYHYSGQMGFTELACDAIGYSTKCSERFVIEFGYITIPMMAITAMTMTSSFALTRFLNQK